MKKTIKEGEIRKKTYRRCASKRLKKARVGKTVYISIEGSRGCYPEILIGKLKQILARHEIEDIYYSLKGYGENAVCLEHRNDKWLVYMGERGNRYNLHEYDNIGEACKNVIDRLAESDDEALAMQKELDRDIKHYNRRMEQSMRLLKKGKKSLDRLPSINDSERTRDFQKRILETAGGEKYIKVKRKNRTEKKPV